MVNYEQWSWPDQIVLPDLAESHQSGKKCYQKYMAKSRQSVKKISMHSKTGAQFLSAKTLLGTLQGRQGPSFFWSKKSDQGHYCMLAGGSYDSRQWMLFLKYI